jgi:hypothetical protein
MFDFPPFGILLAIGEVRPGGVARVYLADTPPAAPHSRCHLRCAGSRPRLGGRPGPDERANLPDCSGPQCRLRWPVGFVDDKPNQSIAPAGRTHSSSGYIEIDVHLVCRGHNENRKSIGHCPANGSKEIKRASQSPWARSRQLWIYRTSSPLKCQSIGTAQVPSSVVRSASPQEMQTSFLVSFPAPVSIFPLLKQPECPVL